LQETRPDPEDLLARVQEEEAEQNRGRLKIFFGANAGVGKTYEMLLAGRKLVHDGVDVVAGYVVTHGRKETEALLDGLEILPAKMVEYKGAKIEEFDLDAALARNPTVILVDELAHTNAEGCRHEKRWQDVEELLDAGITVYTCMNVQHVETANDIVAQITGVTVRETVPDSIFDKAYEVVLIDLTPDELIQRMQEGKVYLPEQSQFALNNFFRKGNLIALRELALRITAERVDVQMRKYRSAEAVKNVWPASERILVCVGPNPLSYRLVRAARRMATGLHAQWFAISIDTPAHSRAPQKDRDRVTRTLRLAEQLGAHTATLNGTNVPEEVISYARRQNISKIIIGKPAKARWQEIVLGSVVDTLIRQSGNIDVYVISGDPHQPEIAAHVVAPRQFNYRNYLYALIVVLFATLLASAMASQFKLINLVMIFQLAIVIIATRWGRGPSIFSSILSVLLFDFLFIPPVMSFSVTDSEYVITLVVMLFTALVISTLTSTIKDQVEMARLKERHTSALYAMTREQASALTKEGVLKVSLRHFNEVFSCKTAVFLPNDARQLVELKDINSYDVDAKEFGVAQWVFINNQSAGHGTSTLPGAKGMYQPMQGAVGSVGVIGIMLDDLTKLLSLEEMHLLETFVSQIALTVERAVLSEQLAQATIKLQRV
jgi:two-component system, OmpR family, sensor histidine kinase KdpD